MLAGLWFGCRPPVDTAVLVPVGGTTSAAVLVDAPTPYPRWVGEAVLQVTMAGDFGVGDPFVADADRVVTSPYVQEDIFDAVPIAAGSSLRMAVLRSATHSLPDFVERLLDGEGYGAIDLADVISGDVLATAAVKGLHHAVAEAPWDGPGDVTLVAVAWSEDEVDEDYRHHDNFLVVELYADGRFEVAPWASTADFPASEAKIFTSYAEAFHTNGIATSANGPFGGPVVVVSALLTSEVYALDQDGVVTWSSLEVPGLNLLGQHGPTLTDDGAIWVFNNRASEAAGDPESWSAVVRIDPAKGTFSSYRLPGREVHTQGGVSVFSDGTVLVTDPTLSKSCVYTLGDGILVAVLDDRGEPACVSAAGDQQLFRDDLIVVE